MIRLITGENIVAVTLTEKVTLDAPYFLFEFENSQGHEKYYCTAPDTSGFPERFNKFSLEVIAVDPDNLPDPLSGELALPYGGQYTYNIYEQEEADNLDPDSAASIVETGIMIFDKELDDRTEFNNTGTRKVFEP